MLEFSVFVQFAIFVEDVFDCLQKNISVAMVLVEPITSLASPSLHHLPELLLEFIVGNKILHEGDKIAPEVVLDALVVPDGVRGLVVESDLGTGGDHERVAVDGVVYAILVVVPVQIVYQRFHNDEP